MEDRFFSTLSGLPKNLIFEQQFFTIYAVYTFSRFFGLQNTKTFYFAIPQLRIHQIAKVSEYLIFKPEISLNETNNLNKWIGRVRVGQNLQKCSVLNKLHFLFSKREPLKSRFWRMAILYISIATEKSQTKTRLHCITPHSREKKCCWQRTFVCKLHMLMTILAMDLCKILSLAQLWQGAFNT